MRVVLASASPRRLALLRTLGIEPSVVHAELDEAPRVGEAAVALALRLAEAKALKVAASVGGAALVVAADTVVSRDGELLAKPASPAENQAMLRALSGRSHDVITAVCCIRLPEMRRLCDSATTQVAFTDVSDREARWYSGLGEGLDKAGGYAIQGAAALWIREIHGSPSNVVGLPMELLRRLCLGLGLDLLSLSPPTDDHGDPGGLS